MIGLQCREDNNAAIECSFNPKERSSVNMLGIINPPLFCKKYEMGKPLVFSNPSVPRFPAPESYLPAGRNSQIDANHYIYQTRSLSAWICISKARRKSSTVDLPGQGVVSTFFLSLLFSIYIEKGKEGSEMITVFHHASTLNRSLNLFGFGKPRRSGSGLARDVTRIWRLIATRRRTN